MAFIVPGLLCSIGLLLIVFRGWLWLRAPARRLCPGPRLNFKQRAWPLWLVYRPRCGYDLSGHALRAGSTITCPECGRAVAHCKQMIRTACAMRPAHLGCVFILMGLLVYQYPPLAATKVVEYTPTEILLRGEGMLGVGTPLEVRDEIRRRAMDHQLRDDQVCRFVDLLINDLQDDSLVNNAKAAIEQLAVFGVFCTESLMAALDGGDAQQRALAADILRELPDACVDRERLMEVSVEELGRTRWPASPSSARRYLARNIAHAAPRLISLLDSGDENQRCQAVALLRDTTLEGEALSAVIVHSINDLRDDQHRGNFGDSRWFLHQHAEQARELLIAALDSDDRQQRDAAAGILRDIEVDSATFDRLLRLDRAALRLDANRRRPRPEFLHLVRHAGAAGSILSEGMRGDDPRERLLCAAVAGIGMQFDLADAAMPILVSHLSDNQVRGDAIIAARAIWGFGQAALPLLEPYRASLDEQQRQSVEYIVQRMTTSRSIADLQRALPQARWTRARIDAMALEPEYLDMPEF